MVPPELTDIREYFFILLFYRRNGLDLILRVNQRRRGMDLEIKLLKNFSSLISNILNWHTKISEENNTSLVFLQRSYRTYYEFTQLVKRRIESINEKDVKDLDRDLLVNIIKIVEMMQDYIHPSLRISVSNFESLELYVYKIFLFSPTFEKTLRGKNEKILKII